MSPIKQISCGRNHTVILTLDNEIYTLGYNNYGCLGIIGSTKYDLSNPTKIRNLKCECIYIIYNLF